MLGAQLLARISRTKQLHENNLITLTTGENLFECEFCGKGFAVRGNLNVHLRFHTGKEISCRDQLEIKLLSRKFQYKIINNVLI